MQSRFALIIIAFSLIFTSVCAEEMKPIQLLAAQTESGMPLMQALKERKSSREFNKKELPLQVLSDLLWAANGISRPGHRTAPSAMSMHAIDIYVARADGLYLYDAGGNKLLPVLRNDIRKMTGEQEFVKDAPLSIIYIADLSKMTRVGEADIDSYTAADTAYISENVYLFCASAGLATVVRGSIDKPALSKAIGLRDSQKIILAQTVGYPK